MYMPIFIAKKETFGMQIIGIPGQVKKDLMLLWNKNGQALYSLC